MRRWMLDHFDDIYIFNLHGDQRNWIRGAPDEKVFTEVQVGIAITIAVRRPRNESSATPTRAFRASIHYREQRGTKVQKYGSLRVSSIGDGHWDTLPDPETPEFLFLPVGARTDYGKWPSVPDLFLDGSYGVGVQTSRDDFIVAFDPSDLQARLSAIASMTVTDEQLLERYGLRTTRDFDLAIARRAAKSFDPKKVKSYRYRLLDRRWIYFDPIFIDWPRQISEQLATGTNVALAVPRQRRGDGQLATVSQEIVDLNLFGSGTWVYPLHQRSGAAPLVSNHNIKLPVLAALNAGLNPGVTPEDVFSYVVGILMSEAYTNAFELRLGTDHPRIPFTTDPALFQAIVAIGEELTRLQSLNIQPSEYTSKLNGSGSSIIARPIFDRASQHVIVGAGLFLTNVSDEVWTYKIGQYYVLERYLEDRVGRVLSASDTTELLRITTALSMTIQVMPALNDLVRQCITGQTFVLTEFQRPALP
jgi:predicted helicase